MTNKLKLVILGGEGGSTLFLSNTLERHYEVSRVIIESGPDKKKLLKRRIKKLGILTVLGQVLFLTMVVPILKKISGQRLSELKKELLLDDTPIKPELLASVSSVNSANTIEMLKGLNPDLIVVNGTRIISRKVLNSVNAKFVNTHVGITPKYRGVHGGYWAVFNDDKANCGVTVHLIDEGIDTGEVLFQGRIEIDNQDSFVTYPYKQQALGFSLMVKAIEHYAQHLKFTTEKGNTTESKLYYHPTIWQYVFARILRKVK